MYPNTFSVVSPNHIAIHSYSGNQHFYGIQHSRDYTRVFPNYDLAIRPISSHLFKIVRNTSLANRIQPIECVNNYAKLRMPSFNTISGNEHDIALYFADASATTLVSFDTNLGFTLIRVTYRPDSFSDLLCAARYHSLAT